MDNMTVDEIREKLQAFEDDPSMTTPGRYSPSATDYPGNILPFSEIHLANLKKSKANPAQYLSNLELMIKSNK